MRSVAASRLRRSCAAQCNPPTSACPLDCRAPRYEGLVNGDSKVRSLMHASHVPGVELIQLPKRHFGTPSKHLPWRLRSSRRLSKSSSAAGGFSITSSAPQSSASILAFRSPAGDMTSMYIGLCACALRRAFRQSATPESGSPSELVISTSILGSPLIPAKASLGVANASTSLDHRADGDLRYLSSAEGPALLSRTCWAFAFGHRTRSSTRDISSLLGPSEA